MPVNMSAARALCTKPELALVLDSTAGRLAKLPADRLRKNIELARRLRDKYGGLASRQRREGRGKQEARGARPSQGGERTQRKQELFADVLARFEKQFASVEQGRPAPRPAVRRRTEKATRRASKRAQKVSGAAAKKTAAATPSAKSGKKAAGRAVTSKVANQQPKATRKSRKASVIAGDTTVSTLARLASLTTAMQGHSEKTRGVRARKKQQRANLTKIQGHVSSRGRRSQARRDSR